MDQKTALEQLILSVQKPGRYVGGEPGSIVKDKNEVSLRFAFCFPDTYEIGMSHLGMKILYGLLNAQPDIWCERVFAPWVDMEEKMRAQGMKLYGLESFDPLDEFDIIGFTLQYELSFTNILNMLDLGGIPVYSKDRPGLKNLVIAGGPCCCNPEPIADFVDLFQLGEGEEMLPEICRCYQDAKERGLSKEEFLLKACQIGGVYVPAFYDVEYFPDGRVKSITPNRPGVPAVVEKRIIQNLSTAYYPKNFVVPFIDTVHDRAILELMRGCIRGCRFCQAGFLYRPLREKSAEVLCRQGKDLCQSTGYEEISLSSLSSSDYSEIEPLLDQLYDYTQENHINLALPSLRIDNFSEELLDKIKAVRRSGLTFAPEAGTQRLRDVINKNITEEDIFTSCRLAFEGGYSAVKLYFMLGLPTETDEDVLGIADLAQKVYHVWRENTPNRSRGVRITVSTSCFVPKSHTPFQWEAQNTQEEYLRKVTLLREHMRNKSITYNWHDPETSYLEAVLSRGDRRIADVIEEAWRHGAKFDSWSEYFNLQTWLTAMETCGVSPAFYANRVREKDEILPWHVISDGVKESYLWRERETAYAGKITPDCKVKCSGCGADKLCKGGICHG